MPNLNVHEAAERLGVHPQTVRRRIRRGELLTAVREGSGPTASWMISEAEINHLASVEAHEQRMQKMRAAGYVAGRGDDFLRRLDDSPNSPETKAAVRAVHNSHNLIERLDREVSADPEFREALADLDDEDAIEAEAQEIARRVRRQERVRARAREILDEDDGEPR